MSQPGRYQNSAALLSAAKRAQAIAKRSGGGGGGGAAHRPRGRAQRSSSLAVAQSNSLEFKVPNYPQYSPNDLALRAQRTAAISAALGDPDSAATPSQSPSGKAPPAQQTARAPKRGKPSHVKQTYNEFLADDDHLFDREHDNALIKSLELHQLDDLDDRESPYRHAPPLRSYNEAVREDFESGLRQYTDVVSAQSRRMVSADRYEKVMQRAAAAAGDTADEFGDISAGDGKGLFDVATRHGGGSGSSRAHHAKKSSSDRAVVAAAAAMFGSPVAAEAVRDSGTGLWKEWTAADDANIDDDENDEDAHKKTHASTDDMEQDGGTDEGERTRTQQHQQQQRRSLVDAAREPELDSPSAERPGTAAAAAAVIRNPAQKAMLSAWTHYQAQLRDPNLTEPDSCGTLLVREMQSISRINRRESLEHIAISARCARAQGLGADHEHARMMYDVTLGSFLRAMYENARVDCSWIERKAVASRKSSAAATAAADEFLCVVLALDVDHRFFACFAMRPESPLPAFFSPSRAPNGHPIVSWRLNKVAVARANAANARRTMQWEGNAAAERYAQNDYDTDKDAGRKRVEASTLRMSYAYHFYFAVP